MSDADLVQAIRRKACSPGQNYDRLVQSLGTARFVLLGEATHGTQEFYEGRARITRQLIEQHGFDAVAMEADWSDALRVNQHVRGDDNSTPALASFERFPRWLWRNHEMEKFVTWLREHNAGGRRAEFFGLDAFSLRASMSAVLHYLDGVDAEAAHRARQRFACFDHFGDDPHGHGHAAHFNLPPASEAELVAQLVELRQLTAAAHQTDTAQADTAFYAEQNTRVARHAESYYRAMFGNRIAAWNLRNTHMVTSLDTLAGHLTQRLGRPAKIVVWAHNLHVGDARATEMGAAGAINLGQMMRERHGNAQVAIVGFTMHHGSVMAATEWDGAVRALRVMPSLNGSFERLFHSSGVPEFILGKAALSALFGDQSYLQRAIGVIYLPRSERYSHYFRARIAQQFDAVVHIDSTTPLPPLDAGAHADTDGEPIATYPSGL